MVKEDSAMKKIINFASGFTIAELLLTMLITTIVAAAMVPVIGLKKVKFPRNAFNHGIAECYYEPVGGLDQNGDATEWRLMFYHADNTRRNDAQAVHIPNEDFCRFEVPRADYFEIIAIGAGQDGYSNENEVRFNVNDLGVGGTVVQPGFIHVDGRYQSELNSIRIDIDNRHNVPISSHIREILDQWANSERREELYALYMLESPVGAGGSGRCVQDFNQNKPGCDKCYAGNMGGYGTDCPGPLAGNWTNHTVFQGFSSLGSGRCWLYTHADGGNSGRGRRTHHRIRVPLKSDTQIRTSTTAGEAYLEVDGRSIQLTAAEAGFTPSYDRPNIRWTLDERPGDPADSECHDGGGGNWCNTAMAWIDDTYIHKGGKCSSAGPPGNCNGDAHSNGRIFYSDHINGDTEGKMLRWDYNALRATPRSGGKGEEGQETAVVYENLRGTLFLRPAPYIPNAEAEDMGRNNMTYVRQDPDDPETTLLYANSGTSKGGPIDMPFTMVNSDVPYPHYPYEMAIPENINHFDYLSKLDTTRFRGGLRNCRADQWCPGYAGKGIYFYIRDVPDAATISLTNMYNGKSYSIPTRQLIEQRGPANISNLCADNQTQPHAMQRLPYTVPNHGTEWFTPHYCKEPKTKGSPGAVIIMW